jgi:hypothetical protein
VDLTAILNDVVLQLEEVRPSARWQVHRRPRVRREEAHPPFVVVDLRRVSDHATMSGTLVNFDLDVIVGYFDGDEVNIDEFELWASTDPGSPLYRLAESTSDYWDDLTVSSNRFFRSDIVFGPNMGRGMTVNVDIRIDG